MKQSVCAAFLTVSRSHGLTVLRSYGLTVLNMKHSVFAAFCLLFILTACSKDDYSPTAIDSTFKSYLLDRFDTNKDGILSYEEAAAIKEIDCSGQNIYRLTGIEDIPNLEVLRCNNTKISYLDVSSNPKLRELSCDSVSLLKVDVSKNLLLETLSCKGATSIDSVILSPGIKKLDMRGHRMDSVNLAGNQQIRELYCGGPNLKVVNVSNTSLEVLDCIDSKVDQLNIDGCTTLKSFSFNSDGIDIDLSHCPQLEELHVIAAENLDVSHSPLLRVLHCENAVFAGVDLELNPLLEELILEGSNQDLIDLSKNLRLANVALFIPIRQTSLDLSNRKSLKTFSYRRWGEGEQFLSSLNLSGCPLLEELSLEYLNITSLDVSNCSALATLKCYDSRLSEINLKGSKNLSVLDCRGNDLTKLEISELTKLTTLNCAGNRLTSLNINSSNLTSLDCGSNLIAELNVRNQSQLLELYCNDNNIKSLDLTGCSSLVEFDCRNTPVLATLNLTGCSSLERIYSSNCLLTSLDVSSCTALTHFYCAANRLQPSLDLSKNLNLKELNCIANPSLTEIVLNQKHTINPLYKDDQTQIRLVQ